MGNANRSLVKKKIIRATKSMQRIWSNQKQKSLRKKTKRERENNFEHYFQF